MKVTHVASDDGVAVLWREKLALGSRHCSYDSHRTSNSSHFIVNNRVHAMLECRYE